jgi:glutamate synthase (NADPH/NADH) large chain
MTGGCVVIIGKVGDNFAAGMTGGMAFIYDPKNQFENYVNPASVVWQIPETDYWKNYLFNLLNNHLIATNSLVAKKLLHNFDEELKNFKQVCPIEMLDKLNNPITLKMKNKKIS